MTEYIPTIPGIIHVTGEHDVGKTTFCFECGAHPSRICFIDADVKGKATVEQIKADYSELSRYVDFTTSTKGMPQLKMFEYGFDLINSIEPGQFDAIIWDTWSWFASSMKAHVRQNPNKFRHPKDWSSMGKMKGAQEWNEAQELEAKMLSYLQSCAPQVFVVTHLKDQYIDDKKTGKKIPDASRTIARIPRFRVWLMRNPSGSRVPVGLVLKRIDKKVFVEGKGLRTVNILPLRVQPEQGDQSLWDVIKRYMESPMDNRDPEPHEVPNEFERSIIDGTLTAEQKRLWALRLKAAIATNGTDDYDDLDDPLLALKQEIENLRGDGLPNSEIAKQLRKESNTYKDISDALAEPLGEVVKWCK